MRAAPTFDSFFQKRYDRRTYNCLHFFVEVWRDLMGVDMSFLLPPPKAAARGLDAVFDLSEFRRHFRRVERPEQPGAALMRSIGERELHVGTFLDGRILHINYAGVQYLPPEMATLGFDQVRYLEHVDHT